VPVVRGRVVEQDRVLFVAFAVEFVDKVLVVGLELGEALAAIAVEIVEVGSNLGVQILACFIYIYIYIFFFKKLIY
jgi:hypothetical protein